jgi:hypothetical protein
VAGAVLTVIGLALAQRSPAAEEPDAAVTAAIVEEVMQAE